MSDNTNGTLQRSDTAATEPPLNEEEMQKLQKDLNFGDSTIHRLIHPEPEQSTSNWAENNGCQLLRTRADTMERYPVVVDPREVYILPHEDVKVSVVSGDQQASPTCDRPATDDWPGEFNFDVRPLKVENSHKNKTWDFSTQLNKLFIDMNKYIQLGFSAVENRPEGLFIRALPIFAVSSYITDPVKRCPNHASPSDASNKDFSHEHLEHLIRIKHDNAQYVVDNNSSRLSVVVPFDRPQSGTDYCSHLLKFMCLGSDVGGINRRPLKVIFTLEKESGEVVGRKQMDVRICSCPKRDKMQEENKRKVESQAKNLADGLARSNSVFTKPTASKKRKIENEEFVMVPVAQKDFEKINEFAEAAVLIRNPEKAQEIKEKRQRLLQQHNRTFLSKPR